MNWDEVEKEAVASMDKKCISNIKQKVKRDIEPFGDNFGAVVSFKEYSHKRDLLYIYSRASFVFKHEQRRPGFYTKRILFFLTESENVAGVLSFLEARQTWVHFSRICRTGCTADESSRGDPRWLGAQRLLEFIFARCMSSEHTRFFVG